MYTLFSIFENAGHLHLIHPMHQKEECFYLSKRPVHSTVQYIPQYNIFIMTLLHFKRFFYSTECNLLMWFTNRVYLIYQSLSFSPSFLCLWSLCYLFYFYSFPSSPSLWLLSVNVEDFYALSIWHFLSLSLSSFSLSCSPVCVPKLVEQHHYIIGGNYLPNPLWCTTPSTPTPTL